MNTLKGRGKKNRKSLLIELLATRRRQKKHPKFGEIAVDILNWLFVTICE